MPLVRDVVLVPLLALSVSACASDGTEAAPPDAAAVAPPDAPAEVTPDATPDADPFREPPVPPGFVAGKGWRPIGLTSDHWLIAAFGTRVKALSLRGAGPEVLLAHADATVHLTSGRTFFSWAPDGPLYAWSAEHGERQLTKRGFPISATSDGETMVFIDGAVRDGTLMVTDFAGANRRALTTIYSIAEPRIVGDRLLVGYEPIKGPWQFSSFDLVSGKGNDVPGGLYSVDPATGTIVTWSAAGEAWLSPLDASSATKIADGVSAGFLAPGATALLYLDQGKAISRLPLPGGPRVPLAGGARWMMASPSGADLVFTTEQTLSGMSDLHVSSGTASGATQKLADSSTVDGSSITWTETGGHVVWPSGPVDAEGHYQPGLHSWAHGGSTASLLLAATLGHRPLRGETIVGFDAAKGVHVFDLSGPTPKDRLLDTVSDLRFFVVGPALDEAAYEPSAGGIRVVPLP